MTRTLQWKRLRAAREMRVSSPAGTELTISLQGAACGGNWGYTSRPGTMTHWPGGIALAFPAAGSVNGTLSLAEGDVNLTFKRYIERPITLTVERDVVTRIDGSGVDERFKRACGPAPTRGPTTPRISTCSGPSSSSPRPPATRG